MKTCALFLAAAGLLAAAGCTHVSLDLAPEGDPHRVLIGTVETTNPVPLPADAVVLVRVVDPSRTDLPPQVLGDQEIHSPGATPVPFRIEYQAEDALLRRGLNLEARISYAGKVRYFNVNQVAVTLRNASDPHQVMVNPAEP